MDYKDFLPDFINASEVQVTHWSQHPGSQPDDRTAATLNYRSLMASSGNLPTQTMNEIAAAVMLTQKIYDTEFAGPYRTTLGTKPKEKKPGIKVELYLDGHIIAGFFQATDGD